MRVITVLGSRTTCLCAHPIALLPADVAEVGTTSTLVADAESSLTSLLDAALRFAGISTSLLALAILVPLAFWAYGEWRVAQLRARKYMPAGSAAKPSGVAPGDPAYLRPRKVWSAADLEPYTGATTDDGPILLAVDGVVYNVGPARRMYGPGGEYACMAGRDATRYLARNSVEEEAPEKAAAPLSLAEEASLSVWKFSFERKYDSVGRLASAEELAKLDAYLDKMEALSAEVEREEAAAEPATQLGSKDHGVNHDHPLHAEKRRSAHD